MDYVMPNIVFAISSGEIALISSAAGIAGAVLGSAAGGFATYKIERQRQHFERGRDAEREAAVLRGVARVWADQLGSYAAMLASVSTNRVGPQWWPDDMHQSVAVNISSEDRKLVASALTNDQWEQMVLVENAIQVIDNARVYARRALEVNADEFGPSLAPGERDVVRYNLPKFELAAGALLSVIGDAVESSVETSAVGQGEAAESGPSAGRS
jgi:hypothetical protein